MGEGHYCSSSRNFVILPVLQCSSSMLLFVLFCFLDGQQIIHESLRDFQSIMATCGYLKFNFAYLLFSLISIRLLFQGRWLASYQTFCLRSRERTAKICWEGNCLQFFLFFTLSFSFFAFIVSFRESSLCHPPKMPTALAGYKYLEFR